MWLPVILCLLCIYGANAGDIKEFDARQQKDDAASYETVKKAYELGIASFTTNITKLISKELQMKNILISPLNVYNALALLHLGSRSITQDELAFALGLPNDGDLSKSIHVTLSNVLKTLQNSTDVIVSSASGLFVSESFQLKTTYVERAQRTYGSEPKNVDFSKSNTTDFINLWISSKTKGRIPEVFKSAIDPNTQLLITTTLYFSGNWMHQFQKPKTQPDKFKCHSDEYDVQLMSDTRSVPYYDSSEIGYRAIALPYEGDTIHMYILLPYTSQHITDVVEKLDGEHLIALFAGAPNNRSRVEYKIPRTKFSFEHEISDEVRALGVKEIFGSPHFKPMVQGSVSVSGIKHVTEIEINEGGTVASAVTLINLLRSGQQYSGDAIKFKVNEPFAFYIYDSQTKSVIFNGVVHKPE